MQFQYRYVGLHRFSVGGGDHRVVAVEEETGCDGGNGKTEDATRSLMREARRTRERSSEIERDIIERFCREEYGERGREKRMGFADAYVAIATELYISSRQ